MFHLNLRLARVIIGSLVTILAGAVAVAPSLSKGTAKTEALCKAPISNDDAEEKYLFVWAGDQARLNPDFLAVVNFDEDSPNYGESSPPCHYLHPAGREMSHITLDSRATERRWPVADS